MELVSGAFIGKYHNDLESGGERGDREEGSRQGGRCGHGGLEGEPSNLNDWPS